VRLNALTTCHAAKITTRMTKNSGSPANIIEV